jgi:K+-transporting ATPase ATPase C chain
MSVIREIIVSIRAILILWVLTAVIYPFLMLAVGQFVFPYQANGSLITNANGEVVGSALIGQSFSLENYFWSRPSTVEYSEGEEAKPTGISGASNLAPSNPELHKRIQDSITNLKQENIQPTADLIYASGSGLDPHISVEAARAQIDRVAQARSLPPNKIETLIAQNTEGRFLGIFGERGVNILTLNLALDALAN